MHRYPLPVPHAPGAGPRTARMLAASYGQGLRMDPAPRPVIEPPQLTATMHVEAALMFEAARRHVEQGDREATRTRLEQGLALLTIMERSAAHNGHSQVYAWMLRRIRSGSPEALASVRDLLSAMAEDWPG